MGTGIVMDMGMGIVMDTDTDTHVLGHGHGLEHEHGDRHGHLHPYTVTDMNMDKDINMVLDMDMDVDMDNLNRHYANTDSVASVQIYIIKSKLLFNKLILENQILKVLSSENQEGSKLGSNNSYWFSVVVLGIIFNF